jgi:hypothetical protein
MSTRVSRENKMNNGADKEATFAGRLAELYYLNNEPYVIDLMWKIAGMSSNVRKGLFDYLQHAGDPGSVAIAEHDTNRIVLVAAQAKASGHRRENPGR